MPIYVFISSFISLKNYTGHKLNNPMWLRTEREFMSIYFHGYDYFSNVFFLDYQEQARVSEKRGYVWQEKSSIYSAFIFLDYILFHWNPWWLITITGVIKMTAFVYLLRLNPYISNLYILDRNTRLSSTQLVWHNQITFRFFSYVANIHLLWRREDVGICWNHFQTVFPWSIRVTNGLEYYLFF